MANSRKSSLHEKLDAPAMDAIQAEIFSWPLGFCDYTAMYERLELEAKGVSWPAFYRHASYLQTISENQQIRETNDEVLDAADLERKTDAALRTRLYIAVQNRLTKAKEIRELTDAESARTRKRFLESQMAAKEQALKTEVQKLASKDGGNQVDASKVADLIDRVMRGEAIDA